jgi:hypothetical protein
MSKINSQSSICKNINKPESCKKRESDLPKGLILLGDPFISVTESDLTQGEVPPHPNPPPPRGEGRVGEDNQVSFFCNVKVN